MDSPISTNRSSPLSAVDRVWFSKEVMKGRASFIERNTMRFDVLTHLIVIPFKQQPHKTPVSPLSGATF